MSMANKLTFCFLKLEKISTEEWGNDLERADTAWNAMNNFKVIKNY